MARGIAAVLLCAFTAHLKYVLDYTRPPASACDPRPELTRGVCPYPRVF